MKTMICYKGEVTLCQKKKGWWCSKCNRYVREDKHHHLVEVDDEKTTEELDEMS
jgi:hypothetical protein